MESYFERLKKIKLGELPKEAVVKKKKHIPKKSAKKLAEEKKEKELLSGGDSDLKKWFSDKMINSLKRCENCGASLARYNEKDWYGSQHHVLEKSLYPSVMVDPDNHLVLGKWCCHSQWHTSYENAAKMPIFPKAISIINTLYQKLTKDEKRKLPDVVIQEIKPETYNSK
jgi:hypothetical protein